MSLFRCWQKEKKQIPGGTLLPPVTLWPTEKKWCHSCYEISEWTSLPYCTTWLSPFKSTFQFQLENFIIFQGCRGNTFSRITTSSFLLYKILTTRSSLRVRLVPNFVTNAYLKNIHKAGKKYYHDGWRFCISFITIVWPVSQIITTSLNRRLQRITSHSSLSKTTTRYRHVRDCRDVEEYKPALSSGKCLLHPPYKCMNFQSVSPNPAHTTFKTP